MGLLLSRELYVVRALDRKAIFNSPVRGVPHQELRLPGPGSAGRVIYAGRDENSLRVLLDLAREYQSPDAQELPRLLAPRHVLEDQTRTITWEHPDLFDHPTLATLETHITLQDYLASKRVVVTRLPPPRGVSLEHV